MRELNSMEVPRVAGAISTSDIMNFFFNLFNPQQSKPDHDPADTANPIDPSSALNNVRSGVVVAAVIGAALVGALALLSNANKG
jgi:hypothetical protein